MLLHVRENVLNRVHRYIRNTLRVLFLRNNSLVFFLNNVKRVSFSSHHFERNLLHRDRIAPLK